VKRTSFSQKRSGEEGNISTKRSMGASSKHLLSGGKDTEEKKVQKETHRQVIVGGDLKKKDKKKIESLLLVRIRCITKMEPGNKRASCESLGGITFRKGKNGLTDRIKRGRKGETLLCRREGTANLYIKETRIRRVPGNLP